MFNLTSFIVLAGLLFFPGPAPADEAGSIAALCARRDLQAVREARFGAALPEKRAQS
jgi:hypothetical protein